MVDILGVLDAARVTKHLRYDDYDQGDHDAYHESHDKDDHGDGEDLAPCNIRHGRQ